MKFLVIVGTRAELIKIFPLIKEIEESDNELVFLHTGQHELIELCETFDIPKPDYTIGRSPEGSSKFMGDTLKAVKWGFKIVSGLWKKIRAESPDYIIYHGDTMSTGLSAFVSSRILFPIRNFDTVHVEAGLRSGSVRDPFPEELMRIFADLTSNILFSPSDTAEKNLKLHRLVGKTVSTVGNTVSDSAKEAKKLGKEFDRENYGVLTVHRHENIKSEKRMRSILSIAEKSPRKLIFPLHDNTKAALKKFGLYQRVVESDNIEIHDLIDYPDFINMLQSADIIYTDGGSMQEESLIFGVPCIILRERTERQEGLETGLNYLSKFDVESTIKAAENMLEEEYTYDNPYGEEGASKRILNILEKRQ